jgi:aminomethyltransferase
LTGPNTTFWAITKDGAAIGKVTSAIHSPRLKQNIALAMVGVNHSAIGSQFMVDTEQGTRSATVVERPFYDPKKTLAASSAPV